MLFPRGARSPAPVPTAHTLAERILAHLREHPYDPESPNAPPEVTQEGIARALDARVAHVSRALAGLMERGRVTAQMARTPGAKRRSRAHALTDEGRAAAEGLVLAPPAKHATDSADVLLRPAELDALTRALDEAMRGGPRVVLLEGDAGGGKTRLLEELRAVAQRKGARWLSARGAPLGAEQTLGPLHEALAPLDIERRFAALSTGTPLERARLASAQALASAAPAVLAIDDFHFAGAGSVEFLRGVISALPQGARVLVVAAIRREEAWELPNGPLYTALMPLAAPPVGSLLHLGPLAHARVRELLQASGYRYDDVLVARVAEESGGNPAYALAMAEALADGVDEGDFFPPRVQLAVKERFSTLSREALEVLQAAAVCGVEFDLALLERVYDGPRDALVDAVDVLIDKLLIEEADGGSASAPRLRFEHPKVREAVLAETTATRQRWLTARVASAQLSA